MTEKNSKVNFLQLENLSFGYPGHKVFSNVSISVQSPHKVISIVGPSGVGKSTLINILAGFEKRYSGIVKVCNKVITSSSSERPVVFQNHNLFPWKTVAGNIEFGLKALGKSRADRRQIGRQILERIGLLHKANAYPHELSGGMRQRIGLARCLAVSPKCILMDEPFNSIDFQTKKNIVSYFLEKLTEFDSRAILVTHDLTEAVTMASCVITINRRGGVGCVDFKLPPFASETGTDSAHVEEKLSYLQSRLSSEYN